MVKTLRNSWKSELFINQSDLDQFGGGESIGNVKIGLRSIFRWATVTLRAPNEHFLHFLTIVWLFFHFLGCLQTATNYSGQIRSGEFESAVKVGILSMYRSQTALWRAPNEHFFQFFEDFWLFLRYERLKRSNPLKWDIAMGRILWKCCEIMSCQLIQKYAMANKTDRLTDTMAYTGSDRFVIAICHFPR